MTFFLARFLEYPSHFLSEKHKTNPVSQTTDMFNNVGPLKTANSVNLSSEKRTLQDVLNKPMCFLYQKPQLGVLYFISLQADFKASISHQSAAEDCLLAIASPP